MGILAGQALTAERGVKEAVASQRSQSVEMSLGRGLQGRALFQHTVRPIPETIQKHKDDFHACLILE